MMKVKELIKALKEFPDNYKVAFESYEEEDDGYSRYNVQSVNKDEKATNMIVIKQLEARCLRIKHKIKKRKNPATICRWVIMSY